MLGPIITKGRKEAPMALQTCGPKVRALGKGPALVITAAGGVIMAQARGLCSKAGFIQAYKTLAVIALAVLLIADLRAAAALEGGALIHEVFTKVPTLSATQGMDKGQIAT